MTPQPCVLRQGFSQRFCCLSLPIAETQTTLPCLVHRVQGMLDWRSMDRAPALLQAFRRMSYSDPQGGCLLSPLFLPPMSASHYHLPNRVHDFLKPLSSDRLSPSLRILDRAFRLRHSIPLIWASFKIVQMDLPCPLPCISLQKTRGMATNSWCALMGKAEVSSFPSPTPLFPHLWVSGCQGMEWGHLWGPDF